MLSLTLLLGINILHLHKKIKNEYKIIINNVKKNSEHITSEVLNKIKHYENEQRFVLYISILHILIDTKSNKNVIEKVLNELNKNIILDTSIFDCSNIFPNFYLYYIVNSLSDLLQKEPIALTKRAKNIFKSDYSEEKYSVLKYVFEQLHFIKKKQKEQKNALYKLFNITKPLLILIIILVYLLYFILISNTLVSVVMLFWYSFYDAYFLSIKYTSAFYAFILLSFL